MGAVTHWRSLGSREAQRLEFGWLVRVFASLSELYTRILCQAAMTPQRFAPSRCRAIALVLSSLLAIAACQPSDPDAPAATDPADPETATQDWSGTRITVLTFDGPQVAEVLQRRAPEFAAQTGASIEIATVPFDELYDTIAADLRRDQPRYDAIVFPPQWLADYAASGWLVDLTERVNADDALAWDDIAPFFRDISATYGDRVYTIPLDGDFQLVDYRTDLRQAADLQPPETWEEYLEIAARFHQQDLNDDGNPDYGSCIAKKPDAQSYWMIWAVASPFLQTQGTQQGAFFHRDTMEPLVDNPAFARAIELYKQTTDYGPPDELTLDVSDTRNLFTAGRCALTLDWGDIGTRAIAPESQVIDKVGAVVLPGSERVLNRETGELVACDKTTCPYAINGINRAPYAAFGGWSGAIAAATEPEQQDLSYAFLSYLSQPAQANVDVTIGASGFNPYRVSQFTDRETWVEAGMSFEAASKYLGAISVSLRSPNVVLDLRIPENNRYQQEVLDAAIADYLVGDLNREQAIAAIDQGWEAITEEVGRAAQRAAYLASLGAAP